jgi:hypothetical protein
VDSPRTGFRRASVASWALVGIGIAGVAGASALAYADTVKPPPTEAPVDATDLVAPAETVPTPVEGVPPAPELTPDTTVDQAPPPVVTPPPVPEYTPEPTVEQAPAPVTQDTPPPQVTVPPTTQRRQLTPTTVMAPNYSPPVTRSRGS